MAFCAMSVNYLKYLYMAVLAALGMSSESALMHGVFTVIGLLGLAIYIYIGMIKSKMTKNEVYLLLILVCFFFAFMMISPVKYGYTDSVFKGMYLTFGSVSIPAFLLGILIKKKDNIAELGKWIPIFSVLITISCLLVSLNPSSQTSGGFLNDESGFDYQTLSYTSAYAFGLTIYYIKYYDEMPKFYIFTDPLWKKIFMFLLPIQFFCVMLSGGRGGFLVIGIYAMYYLILTSKSVVSFFMKALALVAISIVILNLVQVIGIETAGYSRIIDSVTTGQEGSERGELRDLAISLGKTRIVYGHGFGSVFYEIGIYSHNFFTDIFMENGVIGIVLVTIILISFFVRVFMAIRKNHLNNIILIMFLGGFLMLMFSNYYVSVPLIWFAMGYVFMDSEKKEEEQNNEIYLP